MDVILLWAGVICLAYFFCIAFLIGHGTNFYFIWLLLGAAAILFSLLIKKGIWDEWIPLMIRRIIAVLLCLGVIVFVTVEGCIVSGFSQKGIQGLDYLVVLGAQMKQSGPSKALQYRLDEAILYLERNPNTKVIVSGGQGKDEPVSEAQGMYDYLVEKGVEPARIIREDQSKNTFQNMTFSGELLDREKNSVGIVSNDFHIFRALRIAQKAGYRNVYGIAARGEPLLQCNNMMREFFGVVKDFLAGNL